MFGYTQVKVFKKMIHIICRDSKHCVELVRYQTSVGIHICGYSIYG